MTRSSSGGQAQRPVARAAPHPALASAAPMFKMFNPDVLHTTRVPGFLGSTGSLGAAAPRPITRGHPKRLRPCRGRGCRGAVFCAMGQGAARKRSLNTSSLLILTELLRVSWKQLSRSVIYMSSKPILSAHAVSGCLQLARGPTLLAVSPSLLPPKPPEPQVCLPHRQFRLCWRSHRNELFH